jgi:hypothetical protein
MKRAAFLFALSIGLTAACASPAVEPGNTGSGDQPTSSEVVKPVGGDLRVSEPWYLIGTSLSSVVVPPGLTITFAADTVSGQGPVNSWSGSYTATPTGQLDFADVAITAMAGPDEAMKAEAAYQALLETVDGYTAVQAGELYLFDEQANVLVYSATPPVDDPLAVTAQTQALAASVVGMAEAEAEAAVTGANHTFRVVTRDGEQFAVTEDYSPTRINVTVVGEKVTEATIG